MKIKLTNALDLIKADAERRVGSAFARQADAALLLEHAAKRQEAQRIKDGGKASDSFAAAADLEGVTPDTLAKTILGKPDELLEHGNKRRKVILRVRKAATADEVLAILKELGAEPRAFGT